MTATSMAAVVVATMAGTMDVRRGRVPNALTYPAVLVGVALGAAQGGAGLGQSALGLVAALLCALPLWIWGGMGGGDLKLLAAIGAFFGAWGFLTTLLCSLVLGGACAVAVLAWRGELLRALWSMIAFAVTAPLPGVRTAPLQPGAALRIPFGAPIGVAMLLQVLYREGARWWPA